LNPEAKIKSGWAAKAKGECTLMSALGSKALKTLLLEGRKKEEELGVENSDYPRRHHG
jgi:hypothetical protein